MKSQSLTDRAYSLIKTDIITCVLEPGQQIAQPQLAEQHGIGTTPVREALQRLAREGFVQPVPRFGYIVTPLTVCDVHEIYELRGIVESAAARLAAERGSGEDVARIAAAADFSYVYGDRQTILDFLARNAEFHRFIAVVAGNHRLADLISRLLDESARIFFLGIDILDMSEDVRDEHTSIARAILDRDPDRAEQIARIKIAQSRDRVLEALVAARGRSAPRTLYEAIHI